MSIRAFQETNLAIATEALGRATAVQERVMFEAGAKWMLNRVTLPDEYTVMNFLLGDVLPDGALCMWPHTFQGWEPCGGMPVINGPVYAVLKSNPERQGVIR